MSSGEISDEQRCTLWVGGLSDRVDEEILYELFMNAGPVASVRIPTDKDTKRPKPFGFVRFSHAESVPYAVDLLQDVRLFGRNLRLQNKDTGAGMGGGYNHNRGAAGNDASSYNRSQSIPDANSPAPNNRNWGAQQAPNMQQQQQQQGMMMGIQQGGSLMGNFNQNGGGSFPPNPWQIQQMQMQQMQMQQGFGNFSSPMSGGGGQQRSGRDSYDGNNGGRDRSRGRNDNRNRNDNRSRNDHRSGDRNRNGDSFRKPRRASQTLRRVK